MGERTWIAIALCCLVWFAYIKWFAPPPPTPAIEQTNPTASSQTESKAVPSHGIFARTLKQADSVKVQNGKFEVALSDLGGKVSKVTLLGFHETVKNDSDYITPIDPKTTSFTFATLFTDPRLAPLADSAYTREAKDKEVTFKGTNSSGVRVIKKYAVQDGSYLINSSIQISFPNAERRDWGYLLIPVGAADIHYDANLPVKSWEVVAYQNDSITRKHTEQLKPEELVLQGNTNWLAFGNRYFSSVLVNESAINPDIVLLKEANFTGGYLRYPLRLPDGKKDLTFNLKYYVGPKQTNELAQVPGLKQLIDYGMFAFFAYPLLGVLNFFYKFTRNYGIAIILLTISVRLLFYPLSLKGMRSMKNMQKLQPQIQTLKEKYKDDRERFNREQIALFKAHKVNPAGGCLPMLVQLPVFFALYAVLGHSIALFHAPFFGWINDLSTQDPFYIYPVLMGIAMLVQQKMTPTAGMDPTQAKMMLIMPVVFTFLMVKLPSGLTLYIFVSTLLGILQQVSMAKERQSGTPQLVTARTDGATDR